MILLNFDWMVDLAMSIFEFLTKFLGLLAPLTPLGVHPQLFEISVWNRYERFLLQWCSKMWLIDQPCIELGPQSFFNVFSHCTAVAKRRKSRKRDLIWAKCCQLLVTSWKLLGKESWDLPVKEMFFFKIAYDGRGTLCQSIMVGVEHKGTLKQDLVWPKKSEFVCL